MNFINNTEMAALVDAGMGETEITKTTSNGVTTTTIYAGAPFRKAVQNGESWTTYVEWRIRRTVVVENGTTTTVSSMWAEGNWGVRTTLNYQYL